MASEKGIRAGRAFVELFADDSQLVRGLRRAEQRLKAFGDAVRNFGLKISGAVSAVTAPLAAVSIKGASDAQESLSRFEAVFRDQAEAAGQFADALAHSVGRSKFEIRDALATFQSFFVGLGFGGAAARDLSQTMQSLALDFASFHNLSDDEAIWRFISALSGSSEVLDRFGINIKQAALEQELLAMGVRKSWTEVAEQEKVLARLNIIARALGDQGAIGDAVKTAGSFTNQMKRLRGLLRDTSVAIGQALLPAITPLVQKAAEMVRWLGEWISRNQQLVATMFKVAAVVIAGGLALVALGTVISGLGSALGVLATIVTRVGTVFKLLGAAIAFLVSPIGLVVAALGSLAGYMVYASGVGGKALQWLGQHFSQLASRALTALQGMGDAIAAGDLALAAKILWLTLQMEWRRGVAALNNTWASVRDFFLATWTEAVYGAAGIAVNAWAGLQVGWIETVDVLRDAWTVFTTFLTTSWHRVIGFIQKAWVRLKSLFDEDIDVEAEVARINREVEVATSSADRERDQILVERERARRERRQQIESGRTGALGALDQMREEEHAARQRATEQELGEMQSALQQAREEWLAANREAARKRKEAATSEPEPLKAFRAQLGDLQGLLSDAGAARTAVAGTFTSAAAFGLGHQLPQDRQLQLLERIEKNTKDTARSISQNRPPAYL